MNNDEMDFINKILSGEESYLESSDGHQTLEEIEEKREEALYYIYENYLDSENNIENLDHYLKNMKEYEYIEDNTDISIGDYIRYPILDDLNNIKLHTGGYVAKLSGTDKEGNDRPHLFMLKSAVAKEDIYGFKKKGFWTIYKDSIIFRKLTQDDKLNASIAELLNDLLD